MKPVVGYRSPWMLFFWALSGALGFLPLGLGAPLIAQSQPITPAGDGTQTVVNTVDNNQFNIENGTLSGDNKNLFHSFEQFGLGENQIANFVSSPGIRNILGRVVGGNASYINGLVQVTGAQSNLFLINPSGIVFGSNATLNVTGDFTATTATGVGFDNNWLNVIGNNDYASLVGTPSTFAWTATEAGAIVNEGNLIGATGHNLTLLGGTVINTGVLSAPGGNITIAAVPGENLVRIGQEGHLLSLEIETLTSENSQGLVSAPLSIPSLPNLLAGGGELAHASKVVVNENGEVFLEGSGLEPEQIAESGSSQNPNTNSEGSLLLPVVEGDIAIIGAIKTDVDLGDAGNILLSSGGGIEAGLAELSAAAQTGNSGNVTVNAREDIRLGDISASGSAGGGTISVGRSEGAIAAGTMKSSGEEGAAGNITLDAFEDIEVVEIESQGTRGGDIRVSSVEGTIDVERSVTSISTVDNNPSEEEEGSPVEISETSESLASEEAADAGEDIVAKPKEITDIPGNIALEAGGDITIRSIRSGSVSSSGDINLSSENGSINVAGLVQSDSELGGTGNIYLDAPTGVSLGGIVLFGAADTGNIAISTENGELTIGIVESFSLLGRAGNVSFEADADIRSGFISTDGQQGTGEIAISSPNGGIRSGLINAYSGQGTAGNIILDATYDVTVGEVILNGFLSSGNINIASEFGPINAGLLDSVSTEGRGGNAIVNAFNGIAVEEINTEGFAGGGQIELVSQRGDIELGEATSSSNWGKAGNISLETDFNITVGEEINASGESGGGEVAMLSRNGSIQTENISSNSSRDGGANISLQAENQIQTGNIDASGNTGGGDILLLAGFGPIASQEVSSFSMTDGAAGNVTVYSESSISIANVNAWGYMEGGDINLRSPNEAIAVGFLKSGSDAGYAGFVTVETPGNIEIGDINSRSLSGGSVISITSEQGKIDLGGGISTYSESGKGGMISIRSQVGDIVSAGEINAAGEEGGGKITITATGGSIDTTAGEITSSSSDASGSDTKLEAIGDIDAENINSTGLSGGGDIDLTSETGTITAKTIASDSLGGVAGSVSLNANGEIGLEGVSSRGYLGGGTISIVSETGGIDASGGTLAADSDAGNGGNIGLEAEGDIATGSIQVFSLGDRTVSGGEIRVESSQGAIATGSLESYIDLGTGGNITLNAGAGITAEDIDSHGFTGGGDISMNASSRPSNNEDARTQTARGSLNVGSIESFSHGGVAGFVEISAFDDTRTGNINAIGHFGGGDISIASQAGSVDVTATDGILASHSVVGDAGNVSILASGDINTGLIQAFSLNTAKKGGDVFLSSGSGAIDTTSGISPNSQNLEVGQTLVGELVNIDADAMAGTGGQVIFTAANDITSGTISSYGREESGNITITSNSGNISSGIIFSASGQGNGGNVRLEAVAGNIDAEAIAANGNLGGNIEVISGGNFQIGSGTIDSSASSRTGGNVNLNIGGDVTLGSDTEGRAINSSGSETGGQVSISAGGEVDATRGDIDSSSTIGIGGDATIEAQGHVATASVRTDGASGGGRITIFSASENSIDVQGDLQSNSQGGVGGAIALRSNGRISTGNISSVGSSESGDVQVASESGSISTGKIETTSASGTSGEIALNQFRTEGNIQSAEVTTNENGQQQSRVTNAEGVEILANGNTGETTETQPSGSSSEVDNSTNIEEPTQQQEVEESNTGSEAVEPTSTDSSGETGGSANNPEDASSSSGGSENATSQVQNTSEASSAEASSENNLEATNPDSQTTDTVSVSQSGETEITNGANQSQADNSSVDNSSADGSVGNGSADGSVDNGSETPGNESLVADNPGNEVQRTTNNDDNSEDLEQALETDTTQVLVVEGDLSVDFGSSSVAIPGLDASQTQANGDSSSANSNQANPVGTETGGFVLPEDASTETVETNNSLVSEDEAGNINIELAPTFDTNVLVETINGGASENVLDIGSSAGSLPNALDENAAIASGVGGEVSLLENSSPTNSTGTNLSSGDLSSSNSGEINQNPSANAGEGEVRGVEGSGLQESTGAIANAESSLGQGVAPGAGNSSANNLSSNAPSGIAILEQNREREFADYFGADLSGLRRTQSVREALGSITQQTGNKSAVIYVTALPDQLELIVFTGAEQPIRRTSDSGREELLEVVQELRGELTNPRRRNSTSYLSKSLQLYKWLIAPIEEDLEVAGIDTLLFSMDAGLRGLPVAALHDGKQFLVEKYSLSLIPSISLVDTRYRSLEDARVLAMGSSIFQEQEPLPAVPVELKAIASDLWPGKILLNEEFTRENLIQQRENYPYQIVHLATHSFFTQGVEDSSYIQLWGQEQLQLDSLRELGWHNPPVELLVLSACRTALGDEQAELGFAGLAVQAGVKTALASLWYVNDQGTLGLMTEFYSQLAATLENARPSIKAEALRQAQLAMIRGQVRLSGGQLRLSKSLGSVPLPPTLARLGNQDLSHPYYWSGFTMIGSPW